MNFCRHQPWVRLFLISALLVPVWRASAQTNYAWKSVKVVAGGYVPGIIFSPIEPGLAYCRTDIGGFYKWDNQVRQWVPLNDSLGVSNYMGGESIAADPKDPLVVYLAAGMYSNDKAAMMRSGDGGKSFEIHEVPFTMGGNEDGRSVGERLAIDPQATSVLYFGSRHDGLWKSVDSASSWKKVESFPLAGAGKVASAGLSFVVFDRSSSGDGAPCKTIFVGSAMVGSNHLYRSDDAGVSWQAVKGQPANLLALKAEMDAQGTLYITYADDAGPNGAKTGAVWKLEKTGRWTDITPTPSGYCGIALDRQHPGTMIVSTLDHWGPGDDVLRSTDFGKTWKSLRDASTRDISLSPYLTFGNESARFGWWISALALDPFDSNHAMYGTGATIFGTHNLSDADSDRTTHWIVEADGMEETAINCVVSPNEGAHLISGFGDIAGFAHDDLTVSPAQGMFTNPGVTTTNTIDMAAADPQLMVRTGTQNSGIVAGFSKDGGHHWQVIPLPDENIKLAPGQRRRRARGADGLLLSADGRTLLFDAPQMQRSVDLGKTWTLVKGLDKHLRVVADGLNKDLFFALAQAKNQIFVSEDGGENFKALSATGLEKLSRGEGVNWQLWPTPGVQGDLWIAGNTGLLHSTDGGKNFLPIHNAPTVSAGGRCFGFGKAAPGNNSMALFAAGTLNGLTAVYRSDDTAKSWVRIDNDEHRYGTRYRCLSGDPRIYGRVYIGTDGRGVLYGDIAK